MRKLLLFIVAILTILVSCTTRGSTAQKESTVLDDTIEENPLKDWPFPGANGDFVPSRDALEESDTVVDGYPYNRI